MKQLNRYLFRAGVFLVDKSRVEQQAKIRVLHQDHPLGPLSGQGHDRDSAQTGLELRFHHL